PQHYNIGVDVCDRWADGSGRLALIIDRGETSAAHYTFDQLKTLSDQLALALRARGVERGDRVGILLPQSLETALAHIAVYKLGAIAVPLFTLFGTDALQFRLGNSGAKGLITHADGMRKLAHIEHALPALTCTLNTQAAEDTDESFWDAVKQQQQVFTAVDTLAEDPALII